MSLHQDLAREWTIKHKHKHGSDYMCSVVSRVLSSYLRVGPSAFRPRLDFPPHMGPPPTAPYATLGNHEHVQHIITASMTYILLKNVCNGVSVHLQVALLTLVRTFRQEDDTQMQDDKTSTKSTELRNISTNNPSVSCPPFKQDALRFVG